MTTLAQVPDAVLRLRYRAIDVLTSLRLATRGPVSIDDVELLALHDRIEQCNDPSNIWFYPGEINDENSDRPFTPFGKLWRCGSKLCPSCIKHQAQRHRRQIFARLRERQKRRGESYYFITLTIEKPKLGIKDTRAIINRAWSLLRKRSLWCASVYGSVKSEEFTLNRSGYHYHLHLLVIGDYLHFNSLRFLWTECVAKAWYEETGREMPRPKTKDGQLILTAIKLQHPEEAVIEVCKYITKSDNWSDIPPQELRDLALIRRWHRMFEVTGDMRPPRQDNTEDMIQKEDQIHTLDETTTPIVHNGSLSDGRPEPSGYYWRDRICEIGLPAYRQELADQIENAKSTRKEAIMRRYNLNFLPIVSEIENFYA